MDWLAELAAPVITGAITLIGLLIANRKAAAVREVREEMEKKERKAWEQSVTDRLDEHNEYGRKFGEVSSKFGDLSVTLARIDERLKNLEERR